VICFGVELTGGSFFLKNLLDSIFAIDYEFIQVVLGEEVLLAAYWGSRSNLLYFEVWENTHSATSLDFS
jgi:hypothetical protein